ncbi:MAG: sugar ABC transporter permease [Chloroflexota bacterium]|nr:MAG: sugar ABC transporter permease [Chloroflexota bacterium]
MERTLSVRHKLSASQRLKWLIRGRGIEKRRALWAYAFLSLSLLGLLVFWVLPIIAAFGLGFLKWTLLSSPEWAGLSNFQRLLDDKYFWYALKNTFYYVAGVMPGIIISLFLAVLLNQKLRFTTLYRTLYYLPTITMWTAIALVWKWLYSPQYGLVNWTLGLIGIKGPAWLSDPNWAMPAQIFTSWWKGAGYNMLILLAGLQGIPRIYYEAAAIDGANWWQQFRHVTLPLLTPTIYFVVVMTFIGSFGVFAQIYIMTEGGPGQATTTIIYYLYNTAFKYFDIGYADVLAIAFFIVVFTFTIIQTQLQKRWVHYT